MGSCGSSECSQKTESAEDVQMREQLGHIRHKLLVMSGKGGVGKSSVATYLSLGLALRGHRVGLLDVDLHGPSIPSILGLSGMYDIDGGKRMVPHSYNDHLRVISIQCLLEDPDTAIIWRGPVKHGVIKQFVAEVSWGDLDYLVIDSPPGTGDELISVAQTIPDAHAVIVTTPQEVALADVRKSINFCRKVKMDILGLVENMSGYICPHCNNELPLFGNGGGSRTAERMRVQLLGNLPFDPRVVASGDVGRSLLDSPDGSPFVKAIDHLVAHVLERCESQTSAADVH
jgi:ATP-binding protein involved in chromosome partitioning